jgi:hypothetical protein
MRRLIVLDAISLDVISLDTISQAGFVQRRLAMFE